MKKNLTLSNFQPLFRVHHYAKVIEEQTKYIQKKFGKKEADYANYGWFQDEKAICTKIYGAKYGGTTVTSYLGYDGKVYHYPLMKD